ncbi:hypothetical protein MRS44_016012 [Fusarium solani]|uniref:uncharacterized protein n=1 Tax=Fusarium solani TaxID=169388 RepID=UPI0032C4637E|nr:hypothetical protein MRS44_016012 [Fusarium solani]
MPANRTIGESSMGKQPQDSPPKDHEEDIVRMSDSDEDDDRRIRVLHERVKSLMAVVESQHGAIERMKEIEERNLAQFELSKAQQAEETERLRNSNKNLQQQVDKLLGTYEERNRHRNEQINTMESLANQANGGKDLGEIIKPHKPTKFDGDQKKLKTFLTELRTYFHYYPTQFFKHENRVKFAGSCLTGSALGWFEPFLSDYVRGNPSDVTMTIFRDYDVFEDRMKKVFGEVDEVQAATDRLMRLKQTKAASEYVANFLQIASRIPWDETYFKDRFYRGLKEDVKDELCKVDKAMMTLDNYMETAVKIDNRNFARRQEKKGNYGQPQYKAKNQSNHGQKREPDTSHGTEPGPMNMGNVQKGRERKPRDISRIKCYNCNKYGHYSSNCEQPKKPRSQGKKQVNIVQNQDDEEAPRAIRTTKPDHKNLGWIHCYDDKCLDHLDEKVVNAIFPKPTKGPESSRTRTVAMVRRTSAEKYRETSNKENDSKEQSEQDSEYPSDADGITSKKSRLLTERTLRGESSATTTGSHDHDGCQKWIEEHEQWDKNLFGTLTRMYPKKFECINGDRQWEECPHEQCQVHLTEKLAAFHRRMKRIRQEYPEPDNSAWVYDYGIIYGETPCKEKHALRCGRTRCPIHDDNKGQIYGRIIEMHLRGFNLREARGTTIGDREWYLQLRKQAPDKLKTLEEIFQPQTWKSRQERRHRNREEARCNPNDERHLSAGKPGQRQKSFNLSVRIRGREYNALVDSGAEENYMDPEVVNELGLRWKYKKKPYRAENLEGQPFTSNGGRVDREIDHLKVQIDERNQGITFDVIAMSHDLVLGYKWLYKYNPWIDWKTGQVRQWDDAPSSDDDESDDELRSQPSTDDDGGEWHEERTSSPPKGTRHISARKEANRTRRTIAFVKRKLKQMDEVLELQKKAFEEGHTPTDKRERLKNIPLQYRIYQKLFEEELETGLPEHSEWDLEIELKVGTKPKFYPIYNLNEVELRTLKEYLQDMLRKGYIRISKNLQVLGWIPSHDRTPLPLVTELRDRLHNKKWFTALDLKGAYNLIRVKEGDEWENSISNEIRIIRRMINYVLREYLDDFVVCYLDDILIFSETEEEHTEHVHKVLKALQDANLLVEPEKSTFHTHEVEFLGHIISPNEIRMDPKKIAAVRDWPQPENLKEVQSFIGFANYYRRFIRNFGKIAIPLTELTKKETRFIWTPKAEEAFQALKEAILKEPVLATFDPTKEVELETDASDYALGAQVGQRDKNGKLHPIAFYSRKLHGAELNYPIYDKEFLAIINAFKEFRHYLLGSQHKVKVYTDHKNISHFATTQKLSGRQLRYAEYLSEFDYVIIHRKESENGRADAISRRSDFKTEQVIVQDQILHQTPEGHYEQRQIAYIQQAKLMETRRIAFINKITEEELFHGIYEHNQDIPEEEEKTGKMQVPTHLQEPLIKHIHEHKLHGHPGIAKMMERLKRTYEFPKMKNVVRTVLQRCDLCARTKARRHKPYGKLKPLEVAERPWQSITMDFITKLPISEDPSTRVHYDSILVIVDRLTKFSYFLPFNEQTDSEQLAYIFIRNIVSIHGMPNEIISDRGSTLDSKFWKGLMAQLGLHPRMSTAYRPQVDGQTERVNQIVETYLRCYINYEQNNWAKLLPMAQFAYNTSLQESIKTTPAYALFGYTPDPYRDSYDGIQNVKAILEADKLRELHAELRAELEKDRKDRLFRRGDMVYLSTKNIETKRPSKKLDFKYLGPFKILKKLSDSTYKLDLPPKVKLHPVFNISLLESAEGTVKADIGYDDDMEAEDEREYEPEKILDARRNDEKGNRLEYLVKWKGYTDAENTWEPAKHLINAQRLLRNFHQRPRRSPRTPLAQPLRTPRKGQKQNGSWPRPAISGLDACDEETPARQGKHQIPAVLDEGPRDEPRNGSPPLPLQPPISCPPQ